VTLADHAADGRLDLRPDERDLPTALLGNGRLLVVIGHDGTPLQLHWPHPDRAPRLGSLRLSLMPADDTAGAGVPRQAVGAVPLTGSRAETQTMASDADIVTTTWSLVDPQITGSIRLVAHVDADADRLVLELLAAAPGVRAPALLVEVSLAAPPAATPESDRAAVLAIASRGGVTSTAAGTAGLRHLAPVDRTTGTTLTVLALASEAEAAAELALAGVALGGAALRERRTQHDRARDAARTPSLVGGRAEELDRTSLRVLRSLQGAGGGVLAAPECDPDQVRSGGYGYVWPRDLANVVLAAAVAGDGRLARDGLAWLARAQSSDGLYDQRHHLDGTTAPTWGLQLDETGGVLHAIAEVARLLDDTTLVDAMWPTVRSGADALAGMLDPLTGLPPASLDLWEERLGVHTYTAAATWAGLAAASRMAEGRDVDAVRRWADAAARLHAGIMTHLWSAEHGRFLRSRDVARADDRGEEPPPHHQAHGRPAQPVRSVDPIDATIDASLLGLAYPFGVLGADDPRLVATIDAVAAGSAVGCESGCECGGEPALHRYPGDRYLGGNPWVLTTLWLGLARRRPGDGQPAAGLWLSEASASGPGLLPEQVDAVTHRPVWVVPLAWTHAFHLLACRPDHRGRSRA
jgi:glucoamylase